MDLEKNSYISNIFNKMNTFFSQTADTIYEKR